MKKLISILLALVTVLTVLCTPVFAETDKSVVTGTCSGMTYYYRDSYFAAGASEYNASLSTMSAVVALASDAVSSDNWTHQYSKLFTLLGQLGFTDCDVNDDYKVYPSMDSMGAAMAHKTITVDGKTYTLLAIVPRSLNYEAEWGNNFVIGSSGDAQGFSDAAAKIISYADTYVAQYGASFTGEVKLWIAGYSRGAAVANLVAGRLTKAGKIGNFTVAKENIYAYTFETPRGLSTDVVSIDEAKTYTNIHNIITANDLVTKVAPRDWGFIRYGTDESVIPAERNADNEALFERALSFMPASLTTTANGKKIFLSEQFTAKQFTRDVSAIAELGSWTKKDGIYVWVPVDTDTAKNVLVVDSDKSMGDCLDDFITALSAGIGSRDDYAQWVQDTLSLLISEVSGGNYQTKIWETVKATLKQELQANEYSIVIAAATGNVTYLENILTGIANTVITTSGLDVGAYAKVPAQVTALVPILAQTMAADAVIDGGSDILSLIENLDYLFYPHYTEQCMAWLMAQDVNYGANANGVSAAVTNLTVTVKKVTEIKKVWIFKTKVTKYAVTITPVSSAAVQKVTYRTAPVGIDFTGTTFTRDVNLAYLYVEVTDACGNVTRWEYMNGKVSQVK